MTDTGFSPAVREQIRTRSGSKCEICGMQRAAQMHHRRPRGKGSTKRPETNYPTNGLHLCGDCHDRVESDRGEALDNGWLVSQNEDPGEIPVLYRGQSMFLDQIPDAPY
jgi:hypothetical protein